MVKVQGNNGNGLMELLTKRGAHLENITTSSRLGRFFGYGTKATPVSQIGIDTLIKCSKDTKNLQAFSSGLNRANALFWNGTSKVASWTTWGATHLVQDSLILAALNTGVFSSAYSGIGNLYNCYSPAEVGEVIDSSIYADVNPYERVLDGLSCATGHFESLYNSMDMETLSNIVNKLGSDFIHPYDTSLELCNTSLEYLNLTVGSLLSGVWSLFSFTTGTMTTFLLGGGVVVDGVVGGGTVRKAVTALLVGAVAYSLFQMTKKVYHFTDKIPSSFAKTVEGSLKVDNSSQAMTASAELMKMIDIVKMKIDSNAIAAKSDADLEAVKEQGKYVALALGDVKKIVESWGFGEDTTKSVQNVINYLGGIEEGGLQRMQYRS